jgi:hypothetical protein
LRSNYPESSILLSLDPRYFYLIFFLKKILGWRFASLGMTLTGESIYDGFCDLPDLGNTEKSSGAGQLI